MKNRIELTIEREDPFMVQLTNGNGDTFTYNPCKHEELDDFLNGAKILTITDVVGRSEQLVLFARFISNNSKLTTWMTSEELLAEFKKQN